LVGMLVALWSLLACATAPGIVEEDADRSVLGGPFGPQQPTNVQPWFLLPPTGDNAAPGPLELRKYRLADRGGADVPVSRTVTPLASGTLVRLTPKEALAPASEYRVLAPGALLLTFETARRPDLLPPTGGAVEAWAWDREVCPTLTVTYSPVKDASPLFWEVQASRTDKINAPIRATGPVTVTGDAESLQVKGCEDGSMRFPPSDLDLQLRWVDIAGNAGDWSPPVRVTTSAARSDGAVPGATAYTP